MKILLFEDDPLTLEMLRLCLAARGYEVEAHSQPIMCSAFSDPQAECVESESCADILITDNYMPGLTGLEYITQQHARGCKGRIEYKALISGNLSPEELKQANDLGCKVFSKPIVLQELLEWLQSCAEAIAAEPGDARTVSGQTAG